MSRAKKAVAYLVASIVLVSIFGLPVGALYVLLTVAPVMTYILPAGLLVAFLLWLWQDRVRLNRQLERIRRQ
jgi:hypothetical protein